MTINTAAVKGSRSRTWTVLISAALAVGSLGLVVPISAGAAAAKPSAPRAVRAIAGDGLVTVMWSKPANTGGAISKYVVTAHPSNKTCFTPQRVCVLAGLKNGASYSFTVSATNRAGTGPKSRASKKVRPKSLPASSSITEINNASFNQSDAIVSNGTDVWVANYTGGAYGNGSVSKINIATGLVTQIDDPSFNTPSGLAVNGTDVWVTNGSGGTSGNGSVSQINIATGLVTQIDDPSFSYPIGITLDGGYAWVLNAGNGTTNLGSVSQVNIAVGSVTSITDPSFNSPSSITSSGNYVWVANQYGGPGSGSVSKINIATGSITAISDLGIIHNPTDIATNGSAVWVTSAGEGLAISGSDSSTLPILSVINVNSNAVKPVNGPLPSNSGDAVAWDGTNAWVENNGYLYELNPANGKVLQCDTKGLNEPGGISADGINVWISHFTGGASGNGYVTKIAETPAS